MIWESEGEAQTRPRDKHRHDAQRRRELIFQKAVSQMPTRTTDEDGPNTAEEIQRITNDVELQREARRQREREEETREELQEIGVVENILQLLADAQNYSDHRPEQRRNSWDDSLYYKIGQAYSSPNTSTPASSGSGGGGAIQTRNPYGDPEHRRLRGQQVSGSSGEIQTRNPYEDPEYRRLRGQQVLEQERAMADARDRGIEMRQAFNNEREKAYR